MKKRFLSMVLAISLALAFVPNIVFAETTSDGSFEYSVADGAVTITKFKGSDTDVTIPNTIDGYPVKVIGQSAFEDFYSLTSVTVPDGLTGIEKNAFNDCIKLKTINIPDTVKSIGESAFYCCESLTNVTIPDSVTSIGDSAFAFCTSMTNVTIPDSVTSIGNYAFYRCESLTNVTIPDGVTSVGDYAFSFCVGLTNVTIPDGVSSIGEGVFGNCTSLTNVTIPDGVTSIGEGAFCNCTSLINVTIPDGVTSIGDYAFGSCISLTNVTIPDSVTSIGDYAFEWVNNVVYNGSASGSPWKAKAVNGYVENGFVYADNTKQTLLGFSELQTGNVVIPDTVKTIGNYAFYYCKSITDITIPDSVTSIGESAFDCCSSLTNVTIPDSVISIGVNAFYLVNNVIYSGTVSNEIMQAKAVNGYIENGLVYADNTKKTVLGFSELNIGDVVLPDSVTSIEKNAFNSCAGLTSIVIPNGVESIGTDAFLFCTGLTDIKIPDSVTSLGAGAFKYCYELKNATLSDSITSIEIETFYNCKKLTGIEIPDGVTIIGERAFSGCKGLTSIEIPNDVWGIQYQAFYDCINLEKAFLSNASYTNESFPENTTQIRYNADTAKGEATITAIELRTDKTKVDLPAKIRDYSIVAVAKSEHSKVGNHTCVSDGTATCLAPANCAIAGEAYGDVDPNTHEKGKVWTTTETQHKQYWECCNAVVVNFKNHNWNGDVCFECGYICGHKDANSDHKCDYGCEVAIGDHKAADGKHTCDYCGKRITPCKDDDKDRLCDICGAKISNNSGGGRPTTPPEPKPLIGGVEKSWREIAADLAKLPSGSEVIIELNGITTVPVEVIKVIDESDLKVTFVVDRVKSWKTDGSEITAPAAADLTFTKTTSTKSDSLRGIEGTQFKINDTNIPTDIQIAFKTEHAGKFANLYKSVDGKLTFVTCAKLSEDGKVILTDVDEKGDYVAMLCEFSDISGDMSNDGMVNVMDALAVLKQAAGLMKGKNPLVADMNNDSLINAKDALLILKKAAGIE